MISVRILNRVLALRKARQSNQTLDKIRSENPTCRIRHCSLREAVFGKYSTVLDGASLQHVTLGDFSYVSYNSILVNTTIGKFCSIGSNIQIGLAPHPVRDFVSTYPAFYSKSNTGCVMNFRSESVFVDAVPETRLEHDVWIGTNVIIPGGIAIGTGAVVAAGAVVTRDVPPYAVVGGNPAKLIRHRFPDDVINTLLQSEWWNWPIEKIQRNVDEFCNIERFLSWIERSHSEQREFHHD